MKPRQPSQNHKWDGNKWVIDVERLKAEKRAEIAQKRWEAEIGGITIDGFDVATDRDSQAKIQGAALTTLARLMRGALPPSVQAFVDTLPVNVNWKGRGKWKDLDDNAIVKVSMAVFNHVQDAYNKEQELQALIDAATTVDEINAITW